MDTAVSSRTRDVVVSIDRPFVIIGDRINPSGRRVLAAELKAGTMDRLRADATAQVEAGAQMLDVNVGIPDVDEVALMVAAINAVSEVCDVPLCIDSSRADVLEAGLAAYEGRALVNSVTADEEHLERVLPLVRRYDAVVIALTIDANGISMHPRARLALARRIIERAADHGIAQRDVIIDPIVLPVATNPTAIDITLETIRLVRDELGNNITCGASNVSFGSPDRPAVNAAFLRKAVNAGLTCAIANPLGLLSFRPEL